jgi:ubiquinone/menaquinone biosynthesis C-methylase UbiE/uncharacterized protein YbaR (Trm112 family)
MMRLRKDTTLLMITNYKKEWKLAILIYIYEKLNFTLAFQFMLTEIALEIHTPTNASLLPQLISLLSCPVCSLSRFEIHRDESTSLEVQTHCVIVCEECKNCYKYENGILEMLTEQPPNLSLAQKSNFKSLVANYYQSAWRSWCMRIFWGRNFSNAVEAQQLIELLQLNDLPDWPVFIDLGTSHGFYAITIAKKLKETDSRGFVIGIDFSKKMLSQAVAASEKAAVAEKIVWLLADAEKLPLFNGAVDRISCGGSLNEYREPQKVLNESKRVLKENGSGVIMNLYKNGIVSKILFPLIHFFSGLSFFSKETWDQMLIKNGFKISKQRTGGVVMFSLLQK